MIFMASDQTSPIELVPYHEHRRKMKHTYVCKKCGHGFDRREPAEKCILCGSGDLTKLDRDDIVTGRHVYMYTCSVCRFRFLAEKAEKCKKCGAKNLHFYRTTRFSMRELLSMRKTDLKNRLKKRLFGKVVRKSD